MGWNQWEEKHCTDLDALNDTDTSLWHSGQIAL